MDLKFLLVDTRARVYLLWAVLGTAGFLATHWYQQRAINGVWFVICVLGFGYMYKVMPLTVRQMRRIYVSWLVPVALGMAVSAGVFYAGGKLAAELLMHLGAFWLVVMAAGYVWNGLVDNEPRLWYWFAAGLNAAAGVLCFIVPALTDVQYLVAAFVTAWSMLNLWLFRSSPAV